MTVLLPAHPNRSHASHLPGCQRREQQSELPPRGPARLPGEERHIQHGRVHVVLKGMSFASAGGRR